MKFNQSTHSIMKHLKMYQFNLRNLIIYLCLIWLVQTTDLISSGHSIASSNNQQVNKLIKTTKLKNTKLINNKKAFNHKHRIANATESVSLSPAKLNAIIDEDTPKTLYQISRDGRHQMLAFGSEITLALQTQQLIFEQSLVLANGFGSNSSEENEIETSAQESIPFFFNPNSMCPKRGPHCFQSKFRTADGSCNNIRNTRWGKSFECYKRMMKPDFQDGFLMPRASITGQELPNPRFLSLRIHTGKMVKSKDASNMFSQFGQFLDHDMTQTPLFRSPNGNLINCCNGPDRFRQDRCAPIFIGRNDPFYTRFGIDCLNFVRSSPCLTCSSSPRAQLNQLTSFIDASNIYGSLLNHTQALRMFDGTGRLRMSGNELLPPSLDTRTDQCSRPEVGRICFASGDSRANLTPGLVSMHTIWHRQHNSIALALKRINPHWDDERIFQETRRIIGAQMQMITYNEFLPLVIGQKRMNFFNLNVGKSTRYNPEINPSIYTEFASAAFRFGHTLISPVYSRMQANGAETQYWLKDNYFNPHVLKDGEIDNILRGMTASNAARTDPFIADDVRNHLYRRREDGFGSDLIAFNIARAREHGIPAYIHLMRLCFDEKITNFEQLDAYMPRQQRMKLQSMYAAVQDIDLFTGGISEYPMPDGGHVGPTFACVIGKQFADLKFGDRYYFEHFGESGSLTPAQLNTIRQTTLGKVMCDNGDNFSRVNSKVMELISTKNPVIACNDLPRLNLQAWKD